MEKLTRLFTSLVLVLFSVSVYAQSGDMQQIAIPLSHPDKPGKLKVGLVQGSIMVTGYSGKIVIVRYQANKSSIFGRNQDKNVPKGMKMIPNHSYGLDARESDNVVTINSETPNREMGLTIRVPMNFSLSLSTVNGGDIEVKNVHGDLDLNNVNGNVILKEVSGSANANTVNGKIIADFSKINKNTPMAFTTLNGNVDLTFPANAKFSTKMKTDRGNIYTGFDMDLSSNDQSKVETKRDKNVYRVTVNKWQYGKVNGGGPEVLLKSFNGNLYIRKK